MDKYSRRQWLITLTGAVTALTGCQTGEIKSADQTTTARTTATQSPSTVTAATSTPSTETTTDTQTASNTETETPESDNKSVDSTVAGWPQTRATSGNTAAVTGRSLSASNFTINWEHEGVNGDIVADTESIYIASVIDDPIGEETPDILQARSQSDGTRQWKRSFDSINLSSLAISDGSVIIEGGKLQSIDAQTGETEWTRDLNGGFTVVRGERLYIHSSDHPNGFAVLNANDGSTVWEKNVAPHKRRGISTPHAVANQMVYLGIHTWKHGLPSVVKAVDVDTGEDIWETEIDGLFPQMVATGNMVFVSTNKQLFALDPMTGEIRWKKRGEASSIAHVETTSVPVVHEGTAYVTIGETMGALDVQTGDSVWEISESTHSYTYVDGYLYCGSDHQLKVYNADSGALEGQYKHSHPNNGWLAPEFIPIEGQILCTLEWYHRNKDGSSDMRSSLISLS